MQMLISGLVPNIILNDTIDINSNPDMIIKLRDISRTFPGTFTLLPNSTVWEKEVIVRTPKRSYTTSDYEDLFTDIGFSVGFTMYSSGIADINAGYPAPKVPVYCFYGTKVETSESFYYTGGFDNDPVITKGDGDGTVNQLSSEVCLKWKQEQTQCFEAREFPYVNHVTMVKDPCVLDAIKKIVLHSI